MERVEIESGGTTLVGYWHWPAERQAALPVIVMGHGFGSEWTFGTAETIADFVAAGYAVFTFDYRHYGESAGEPRHLLNVKRQLDDWRAVLSHVRDDRRIDGARLAIWGSSLGGGHALSIASEDHDIAAVAAQVPHCNATDSLKNIPPLALLRTTGHALFDAFIGLFGGLHTIPILNEPGEVGAMTFPGWKTEGLRLAPPGSHWENKIPARSMLSVSRYSPEKAVRSIQSPVCVHYGRNDMGVPAESVERTVKKIKTVEVHRFEGDHFDVYHGELRRNIAATQLAFFRQHMFGNMPRRQTIETAVQNTLSS
jgi:pimeloyl-ACP methyl ester carboxylesterase